MNFVISSSSDPYWNLATEEYLLKNSTDNFIFLYVNQPCVVVGKHQIAQKEINSKFVFDQKIKVARRLSGGGTVYHDKGNLNFSYIQSVEFGENISYKNLTKSIFTFLQQLNKDVVLSDRNDFLLDGKKISGSAMHVFKNRVLAHGTLLIDCDLQRLSTSLRTNSDRYVDKSIASHKSAVMNFHCSNEPLNLDSLINSFKKYLATEYSNFKEYYITEQAIKTIQELVENKYATLEWIYGYSPKYIYKSNLDFEKQIIPFSLTVEKGKITHITIESQDELNESITLLFKLLQHKYHVFGEISPGLMLSSTATLNYQLTDALF